MLKKSASIVLASLRGSPYSTEYDSPLCWLWPCQRKGASWTLASSVEPHAGVEQVRCLVIVSILYGCLMSSHKSSLMMC